MSKNAKVVKEIRVPLTHYQGEPRADWLIKVYEVSNGYGVLAEGHNFGPFDDMLLKKILSPLKAHLNAEFDEMIKLGSLRKSAELDSGTGAYLMLIGFYREHAAIGFACQLAEKVERVLSGIPKYHLDRENLIKSSSNKPEVFDWVDTYNKRNDLIDSIEGC